VVKRIRYSIEGLGSVHLDHEADFDFRRNKAKRIVSVLTFFGATSDSALLDLGTGPGIMASEFSRSFATVASIDIADSRLLKDGYKFQICDDKIPYPDESFDVVVINQVIEHVANQPGTLGEIHRVLKKSGIVYLAGPNSAWFWEPHFRLPFLNWIPEKAADFAVRTLRKADRFDVRARSVLGFSRLFRSAKFKYVNLTPFLIKGTPRFFGPSPALHLIEKIPLVVLRVLSVFSPTLVYVLVRHDGTKNLSSTKNYAADLDV
jgi:SAM-dependent methyltransferase